MLYLITYFVTFQCFITFFTFFMLSHKLKLYVAFALYLFQITALLYADVFAKLQPCSVHIFHKNTA